jgi:hypothetical protein
MKDSSNSPPSAGDPQDRVFPQPRSPDQQGAARRNRNKRRKEKSPESEQENVDESEGIGKSNNDIQDSGSVLNTPREDNVSTVASVDGINSPSPSVGDDYVPTGNLFNSWNTGGTPQEEIEFSSQEPNTPTLNEGNA